MIDLKCPNGHSVPDPDASRGQTRVGAPIEDGTPAVPHVRTCPECGVRLIRDPDSPHEELRQWREDDGPSGTE